jgi:hypothetical protein
MGGWLGMEWVAGLDRNTQWIEQNGFTKKYDAFLIGVSSKMSGSFF